MTMVSRVPTTRTSNMDMEYTDVLPSLNLNFAINEEEQLRFAASKVIGRPPVYQLRGGAGSWIDTANDGVSKRYNVWSKGNPNLDPFRATQLDLSYERYMGTNWCTHRGDFLERY